MPAINVEGVELNVYQDGRWIVIEKCIGRDRKNNVSIMSRRRMALQNPIAETLVKELKGVAARPTKGCTCDYRYGFSDHAEHCQSIYVASGSRGFDDD